MWSRSWTDPGVERVDGTGTGRLDVTFVLPEFVNPDGHTYEFYLHR